MKISKCPTRDRSLLLEISYLEQCYSSKIKDFIPIIDSFENEEFSTFTLDDIAGRLAYFHYRKMKYSAKQEFLQKIKLNFERLCTQFDNEHNCRPKIADLHATLDEFTAKIEADYSDKDCQALAKSIAILLKHYDLIRTVSLNNDKIVSDLFEKIDKVQEAILNPKFKWQNLLKFSPTLITVCACLAFLLLLGFNSHFRDNIIEVSVAFLPFLK